MRKNGTKMERKQIIKRAKKKKLTEKFEEKK